MGEDELLRALEDEGYKEARVIEGTAKEKAAEILDEARAEHEREAAKLIAELEVKLARERTVAINRARLKATGALLTTRREIIDSVIKEGLEAIRGGEDFPEIVQRFFQELKEAWPDTNPRVHLAAGETEYINDPGAVVMVDDSIRDGVVFISRDGKRRFENTLSSRLGRIRKNLVPRLDKKLFT